MKKVLVIGFNPYDERMYPHVYDVLRTIENYCDLIYFGEDDRGRTLFRLGETPLPLFRPRLWRGLGVRILTYYRKIIGIQNKIKKLFDKDIDIVIAIDHSALHYASKYLKENTRLVFWSLDIIAQDHPWMVSFLIRKLISENRKEIKKCDLIIIQDHHRAAVLDSILNSHNINKLYLPVSLSSDLFFETEAERRSSQVLHEHITLMQLGSIAPGRNSHRIIDAFQKMPDNIFLILKGNTSDEIRTLTGKTVRKPILHPGRSETFREMREIVNQADIGIIACEMKDINNYFFSMASGQLVEYLRLGIPVIVLDMMELGEFVDRNKCGLSIAHESQLEDAIHQIVKNHDSFSRDAYSTFRKFYDIELYRENLIKKILNPADLTR